MRYYSVDIRSYVRLTVYTRSKGLVNVVLHFRPLVMILLVSNIKGYNIYYNIIVKIF
jgi:hypothetical protein